MIHQGGWKGSGDIQSFSGGGVTSDRTNGHNLCGGGLPASDENFMENGPYGPVAPYTQYVQGSVVDIEVVLTAHHKGHFEFRLCNPGSASLTTQECLSEHVLEFDEAYTQQQFQGEMNDGCASPADMVCDSSLYSWKAIQCDKLPASHLGNPGPVGSCCDTVRGGTCSPTSSNKHRWVIPKASASNTYTMKYKLPAGVVCDRCVLQWYYQTGNSPEAWPEAFYNCADITILGNGQTATPTVPTATRAPVTPSTVTYTRSPGTAAYTPSLASTNCVSISEQVTTEWCKQVNCAAAYSDFCKFEPSMNNDPSEVDSSSNVGVVVAAVVGSCSAVLALSALFVFMRKPTNGETPKVDFLSPIAARKENSIPVF